MHNSQFVGLDKPYMRKLRIAMNPNLDRKKRENAAANIRRGIAPMLEVAKLETEVSSICAGKISPNDRFIMKKRIMQVMKKIEADRNYRMGMRQLEDDRVAAGQYELRGALVSEAPGD
jgi:hypothetical protein